MYDYGVGEAPARTRRGGEQQGDGVWRQTCWAQSRRLGLYIMEKQRRRSTPPSPTDISRTTSRPTLNRSDPGGGLIDRRGGRLSDAAGRLTHRASTLLLLGGIRLIQLVWVAVSHTERMRSVSCSRSSRPRRGGAITVQSFPAEPGARSWEPPDGGQLAPAPSPPGRPPSGGTSRERASLPLASIVTGGGTGVAVARCGGGGPPPPAPLDRPARADARGVEFYAWRKTPPPRPHNNIDHH